MFHLFSFSVHMVGIIFIIAKCLDDIGCLGTTLGTIGHAVLSLAIAVMGLCYLIDGLEKHEGG